jgi:hypothetical protein
MRPLLAAALLVTLPLPALAQGETQRLSASYVVRQDGKETGRERLVVYQAALSSGAPGVRWELDVRRLSGDELKAVLRQSSDGMLDALQLETRGAEGSSVLRAAHRGSRLVISLTGDRIRRARELPASEHTVLLDAEVHGLLFAVKDLATEDGAPLVGIYPRTGDRVAFTARREAGPQGTTVVTLSGGLTGRLVVGGDGLVDRLDLTSARLVLERLPG